MKLTAARSYRYIMCVHVQLYIYLRTGYDRKLQKQDSLTCCAEVGRCGTTNRHCPKSLRLGRWMKKKMQKRCIPYLCVPKSNPGPHSKSRCLERSEAMEVKMLSMLYAITMHCTACFGPYSSVTPDQKIVHLPSLTYTLTVRGGGVTAITLERTSYLWEA